MFLHLAGKLLYSQVTLQLSMAMRRDVRDFLDLARGIDLIDDIDHQLLYNVNRANRPNLEIPYWQYQRFDLERLTDDECRVEFRLKKNDIYDIVNVLQIPNIVTYNRLTVEPVEGLCILLKRLAYPCRYSDMVPRFARPIPELCIITNHVMNLIYNQWSFLLSDFEGRNSLSPQNLEKYAAAIHAKGAPLTNCWGFIDGTVRPISRPGNNQRAVYNGHKRVHAIKFQSVATPDGLVSLLAGPYEGKRHDSGMLRESGLLPLLERHSLSPAGEIMCIYGDPAYPLRPQLQAPFKGANITEDQQLWNSRMSSVRVSVEWLFGDIINFFKFIDFKKNLKIEKSIFSFKSEYVPSSFLLMDPFPPSSPSFLFLLSPNVSTDCCLISCALAMSAACFCLSSSVAALCSRSAVPNISRSSSSNVSASVGSGEMPLAASSSRFLAFRFESKCENRSLTALGETSNLGL